MQAFDHLEPGGQGDGEAGRHRVAGPGHVEDGHRHGRHVGVRDRPTGLLAAEQRDPFGLASDGQGRACLFDEQARGRLEAAEIGDRPFGGDRGLLEVGCQHGRAGIAAIVAPGGVDDHRHALAPGPIEGGGDDLRTEHSLAVVFQDHGVGLGGRGPGRRGELGDHLSGGIHPALAVYPQELLVVGDEPGLEGRGAGWVDDQAIADVGMRDQEGPQLVGGPIGADQADHPHLRLQADHLHRHVGGPAGHVELVETSRTWIGASGLSRSASPFT